MSIVNENTIILCSWNMLPNYAMLFFFFFSFFGQTEISTNWRLSKTKISSHIRETDAKQTPTKQFEEKKNCKQCDHREQQTTDVHRLRLL